MPVLPPVRVAIVVAALVAYVVEYRWWTSPERRIHRLLSTWHLRTEPRMRRD